MKHSKLTTVAHVHGSGCAGLMIALLRGAGIPAFIDDFYTGHVFSDASYAFGGMRIQVPNHHATEAQALIGSVSPFSSTPMRWLRAIILMTMFLTIWWWNHGLGDVSYGSCCTITYAGVAEVKSELGQREDRLFLHPNF